MRRHIICLIATIVLLSVTSIQCSRHDTTSDITAVSQPLTTNQFQLAIDLPSSIDSATVLLGAASGLDVRDGAVVGVSGSINTITNSHSGAITLGADSRVENVFSSGSVSLADRARVSGFLSAGMGVTRGNQTVVSGPVDTHASFDPVSRRTWTVTFPDTTLGDIGLEPGLTKTISPGRYGAVNVKSRSTLTLKAGVYYFDDFVLEPQAQVALDETNGPVAIYVRISLIVRGTFVSTDDRIPELFLGYIGSTAVFLEARFIGTIVAPNANLTLRATSTAHQGQFFANTVTLDAHASVLQGAGCLDCALTCNSIIGFGNPILKFASQETLNGQLVTQDETLVSDATTGAADITRVTKVSGDVVLAQHIQAQGESLAATIDYGVGVQGIRHADSSSDGQTISMVIDGRAVAPFSVLQGAPNPIQFSDGGTLSYTVDPAIMQAVQKISEKSANEVTACLLSNGRSAGQSQQLSIAPPRLSAAAGGEPGHTSDPGDSIDCLLCDGVCLVNYGSCTIGKGVGCAALYAIPIVGVGLGIACDVAAGVGCGKDEANCIHDCDKPTHDCCPVGCGNGCCAESETCLDTEFHLCCNEGKTPCHGPFESCVDTSLAHCMPDGQSCPFVNNCGSDCCIPDQSSCINEQCCPTSRVCDNTCCNEGETCNANHQCVPRDIHFSTYRWSSNDRNDSLPCVPGQPCTPMTAMEGPQGLQACFLMSITGRFKGGGEFAQITSNGGIWILTGLSLQGTDQPVIATAGCFDVSARSEETSWSQSESDMPAKPLGKPGEACFLTSVKGHFAGGGERIEVKLGGGAWLLGGHSLQLGVATSSRCVPGSDLFTAEWKQSSEHAADLGPKANRACFLTAVQGHFEGGGERVTIDEEPETGHWRLSGDSHQQDIAGTAYCITPD